MKKMIRNLSTLITFFLTVTAFPQPPQAFNYQTLVRDVYGDIIPNHAVGFSFFIHSSSETGSVVYSETHTAMTDEFGIISLEIGTGAAVTGIFSDINWGSGKKFLEVKADLTGGTMYDLYGTAELLSVPYALFPSTAGNASKWQANGDDIYFNTGKVGIGTSNPMGELHVKSPLEWAGVSFIGTGIDDLNVDLHLEEQDFLFVCKSFQPLAT